MLDICSLAVRDLHGKMIVRTAETPKDLNTNLKQNQKRNTCLISTSDSLNPVDDGQRRRVTALPQLTCKQYFAQPQQWKEDIVAVETLVGTALEQFQVRDDSRPG